MSDFLSNLVERSVAATGTVRPQLLSIFESPPANGGAFFRDAESSGSAAVEQQNHEPTDRMSRVQSLWPEPVAQFVAATSKPASVSSGSAELLRVSLKVPSRLDPPGGQQTVAHSTDRRGATDAAETNEGNADAIPTELSTASPQLRPRLALPRRQRSETPEAELRLTTGAAETDEDDGAALRPQLSSAHDLATSTGASESVFHDATRNPPCERRAEKIIEMVTPERETHRELTRARHVHAVSPLPPSPRPLAPARRPKNPSAAPSINVTIGRVEIRAVPPPAQQRAKPKPATVLSLEDYLRQRAKGAA